MSFDGLCVVEGDKLAGEFYCDGGHDVIGDLVPGETVYNVGFAGACVSDEDDSLAKKVLLTMSLN